MLRPKSVRLLLGMGGILLLGACSSAVFPDFEDDNTEVIIHEGGKVEVRKVDENGVLVSDKDNAAYDDEDVDEKNDSDDKNVSNEDEKTADVEKVQPAKVVEVKKEKIEPVKDNVKIVEGKAEEKNVEPKVPTMHYLAATIYFENGGAVVDASYRKLLREIAKLVKDNDAVVTVYGFASSRTRDTDPVSHKLANFNISAQRAQNAVEALRKAGVPADKISSQALSDSMPLYQEVMPEGERLNRRAEIYLTY